MQNNKKIGILTFHASHNFGSMLQAFALQQVLGKLGCNVKIINFRSMLQRKYRSGEWHVPLTNWRTIIKKLLLLPWRKDLITKYQKFEDFSQHSLRCTSPYNTEQEVLERELQYDIYVAGSDQIWNTHALDFSWLYFLPFHSDKKVAYAPSLGDRCQFQTAAEQEKAKYYLSDFSAISVREESGADLLGTFVKRPTVALDPTLLLSAEEWIKHIDKQPIVTGDYLFVYSPYRRPELKHAIPADNTLPLVISTLVDWPLLYSSRYIKRFDTGPWDFLNLIYHSKGVVSGSFHAAVFAKLFNKPLYCLDMGPGSRISNLEEKFKNLEQERAKSIQFLKEALQ